MGVYVANKVLSGVSAILSLSLIAVCTWTLISLIEDGNQRSLEENCNVLNKTLIRSKPECKHLADQNPSFQDEEGYHEAVVINGKKMPKPILKSSYAEFDDMNKTFRLITLVCICVTIGASLVQFICSVIIVISPSFRVAARSRKIVGILFAIFIVYLVAFGSPLACKREKDTGEDDQWHTMTTLNVFIKDFFMRFSWGQLGRDLYLFYMDLFVNIIYTFLNMIIACCLLRWADYEDYDI
ncbi:hypothetical protein Ocin01_08167 [Orchesella cincta]|uniref:Uncharacterized protein n=1 Tax=Orchesella cincta TaxID=48709 RepID=A0A1D2MZP8_ORCCI|nr:hypothetical protein Ocin01_08167 [Orchesella cincta]